VRASGWHQVGAPQKHRGGMGGNKLQEALFTAVASLGRLPPFKALWASKISLLLDLPLGPVPLGPAPSQRVAHGPQNGFLLLAGWHYAGGHVCAAAQPGPQLWHQGRRGWRRVQPGEIRSVPDWR